MPTTLSKKILVIVESPAKAKTIEKYLGDSYIVRASIGHIRDIPKSNTKAINMEDDFRPNYEISAGKDKVVAELKSLAKKAKNVLLATDPDREGEAIAWHIAEVLETKNAKRIVFHEITEHAIKEAVAHPRAIDLNLKSAQEARRVLDRLVGYDLSGLIWKKVRYGLSAGRVQSPALRIIMEREREIRAFIPETFWRIGANVTTKAGEQFAMQLSVESRDELLVKRILSEGNEKKWQVLSVKESEAARSPRAPFTTSTLQQTASTRLGYSPSNTMRIAQKLYEGGYITYMRTDSTNLSKDAQHEISLYISSHYDSSQSTPRTYKTKSKNAQEAHEAIRPTSVERLAAGRTPDEQRLYKLIWSRTVASQMKDAIMLRTKIIANLIDGSKDIPDFHANGSRLLSPGWLRVDPDAQGEEVMLPKVVAGELLKLNSLTAEERQTEPPSRYTEAGLVKELEKRDIGRPSTYASILKTILDRGYVTKDGKTLTPTDTGDVVSSFLEKYFERYISDTFTAEMEQKLDDISEGKAQYAKTLKDFYGPFSKEVKVKNKEVDKITNLGAADSSLLCPKCGSSMIIKLGKNGRFLSCSTFPTCDGLRGIDGKEIEGPKPTGEKCPKCAKGDLIEREGKFGRFIACANYPKCKYIKKDVNLNPVVSSGVKCNVCKKDSDMIERKGRFGIFWSCANYPECKHAIKAKPTGNVCPMCQSLMMEGTKTIPKRCSNKACANHNPHKLEKGRK